MTRPARIHAESSLMSPDAPVWIPRTTTLVLTPSQMQTVRGAVRWAKRSAAIESATELDRLEAYVATDGLLTSAIRATNEPDASVRDRLLMLLDTALAQDGPEVDPDDSRDVDGAAKPALAP